MRFGVLFAVALGVGAASASLTFAQEAKAEGPLGALTQSESPGALAGNEVGLIPPDLTADEMFTPAAPAVTDDGASPLADAIDTTAEILEPVAEWGAPLFQLAAPAIDAAEALVERPGAVVKPAAPLVEAVGEIVPELPESIKPVEPPVPVTTLPVLPAAPTPILPALFTPDAAIDPQPRLALPPDIVIPAAPAPLMEVRTATTGAPSPLPVANVIPNAARPVERPVPLGAVVDIPVLLPSGNSSSRAPVPDAPSGAACIAALAILGAVTLSRGPRLAADGLLHSRACPQVVPPG